MIDIAMPRRVSSLAVVADVAASAEGYARLGMRQRESGEADCVGLVATHGGVILVTAAHLGRSFNDRAIAAIGSGVPYLHVDAIDAVVGQSDVTVLDQCAGAGLREAVISVRGQTVVLAETERV